MDIFQTCMVEDSACNRFMGILCKWRLQLATAYLCCSRICVLKEAQAIIRSYCLFVSTPTNNSIIKCTMWILMEILYLSAFLPFCNAVDLPHSFVLEWMKNYSPQYSDILVDLNDKESKSKLQVYHNFFKNIQSHVPTRAITPLEKPLLNNSSSREPMKNQFKTVVIVLSETDHTLQFVKMVTILSSNFVCHSQHKTRQ